MSIFEPLLLEEEKRIHAGWEGWCKTILPTTGFDLYINSMDDVKKTTVQTGWVDVTGNIGPFLVLEVSRHARMHQLKAIHPHLKSVESRSGYAEGVMKNAYSATYDLYYLHDEESKPLVDVVYMDYMGERGMHEWYDKKGVVYAGAVADLPLRYQHYITGSKPFCVISEKNN